MGVVNTGIRRRARLLGEALRPPRQLKGPGAEAVPAARTSPEAATPQQAPAKAGPKRSRPPKKTVEPEYGVAVVPRQVEAPVFVLAPVRSGSTLLRMLLNSHSRIRAPHELHLRTVGVDLTPGFSDQSMLELGLDKAELEHVLWDRVLHLELERSGKDVVVDKTPGNVWAWERLKHAWPRAKFLFLLRHPEGVVTSLENRRSNTATRAQLEANALKYFEPLERARTTLDGHTLTYEDLTADPERVMRGVCAYLDVEFEDSMLEYGEQDHGRFRPNFGDRSANIKSGRIQSARTFGESPDGMSPRLAEYAAAWGYR
ncbi:sulfotransferase family protein [Streptomyces sp. MAR4 CNX-425]|uniref:sulfotransferase family protein n=1 Tax=Streptomyces sp. MAR4 CNX-425 TaxID=3406343 RepID=UPI003B507DF8